MTPAAPILMSLLLGLWPFGNDHDAPANSVGSLSAGDAASIEDKPVAADAARARSHYARYLEMESDGAPEMRAVALRRLGDLTLEDGERLSADGEVAHAKARFAEAAGLYRRFLDEFSDHKDASGVRYQLARALAMGGDESGSIDELDALVDASASDDLESEAYFRRGEAMFSSQQWRGAEDAYRSVLEQPGSNFHEQARYKLGWALFKQGLHEASLDYFFEVADDHLVDGDSVVSLDSLERAQRELVDDSLRAIAIGFSYTEGPSAVDAYLETRISSAAYTSLIYDRLGALYLDQERYQDAADTYATYVAAHLMADDAPAIQIRVEQAYREGRFAEQVLAAKRDFAERFGIASGFWDQWTPQQLPDAWAHLRLTLDELAEHYHALARTDGSPDAVAESVRWYQAWLATFPDDPEGARRQFLLGELLFDSDRFAEAAEAYERSAYDYAAHDDAAEAGHAAVLAWRRVAEHSDDAQTAARSITATLRFADTFPQHPEALAARVDASQQLFDAGQLQPALQQAEIVMTQADAGTEQRQSALLIAGHSAFDLSRYDRAESAYVELVAASDDPAEREALLDRLAASIYRQGEAAATAGSTDAAIAHFGRVADVAPGSGIAATADYDAAVLLMESGQWARAADALRLFRSRYPEHEYQDRVTVSLATVLTEGGDVRGAADELLNVADLAGQPQDVRRAAQWQAARLYDESGSPEQAVSAWDDYVERYPEPLDAAMEARQRIADLYGERGDAAGRLRWLQAIIDADRSAPQRTDRGRTLAAGAALELADVQRVAYEAVTLSAPLDRSVPAKKASMEAALDGYGQAAEYSIAEVVTEATYRIAQIYRGFGAALMDSERPDGLDADTLEQYEILLEEQAFPFEEKAIEIHESNAARAREGLYNEWVVMSFEALADLMPARYARNEMGVQLVYRLY